MCPRLRINNRAHPGQVQESSRSLKTNLDIGHGVSIMPLDSANTLGCEDALYCLVEVGDRYLLLSDGQF